MNKYFIAGVVVAALVAGAVGGVLGAKVLTPQLAGDFAGGITRTQLFSASVSTNSATPNLSNLYVPGAVSVSGVSANNQITALYTATTSYPVASAVTRSRIKAATGSTPCGGWDRDVVGWHKRVHRDMRPSEAVKI
jgi:hypothetical protein